MDGAKVVGVLRAVGQTDEEPAVGRRRLQPDEAIEWQRGDIHPCAPAAER